jgi:hypothetical protein
MPLIEGNFALWFSTYPSLLMGHFPKSSTGPILSKVHCKVDKQKAPLAFTCGAFVFPLSSGSTQM